MQAKLKRAFLHCSKWLGLFQLSRRLTRRGLRILCYHGFARADEAAFRSGLFINPATFEQRLRYLSKNGFPVLPLEQALDRLRQGDLPAAATVITIDDGFYSVYSCALGLLRKYSFPATLYVTSYYCVKGTPVFRLIVAYLFWKTREPQLDLSGLGLPKSGQVSLATREQKERVMWEFIRYGETQCSEAQRCALAETLGHRLLVDYPAIALSRSLSLVTPSEIREMVRMGMDIQLHTHRHRFPEDGTAAIAEIRDNRAVLEPLVGNSLRHFCYPSGVWSEKHWPLLAAAGVRSATTCEPGLNYPHTPELALRRLLDSEHVSQIEFEAEMAGYAELARQARAHLSRLLNREKAGSENVSPELGGYG